MGGPREVQKMPENARKWHFFGFPPTRISGILQNRMYDHTCKKKVLREIWIRSQNLEGDRRFLGRKGLFLIKNHEKKSVGNPGVQESENAKISP